MSIEKKERIISIKIDQSQPILSLFASAINEFFPKLMDGCPRTYYIKVEIGNNHPEMITFPMEKIFRGDGEPLQIDY